MAEKERCTITVTRFESTSISYKIDQKKHTEPPKRKKSSACTSRSLMALLLLVISFAADIKSLFISSDCQMKHVAKEIIANSSSFELKRAANTDSHSVVESITFGGNVSLFANDIVTAIDSHQDVRISNGERTPSTGLELTIAADSTLSRPIAAAPPFIKLLLSKKRQL